MTRLAGAFTRLHRSDHGLWILERHRAAHGVAPLDGCQLPPIFFNGAEIDARHGAVFDPLPIVALRGAQAMAAAAIHVVPDNDFDDWIVRDDIGPEFGHYPPERSPNGSRRRSCKSARPNS
jgi:hypothetical protein